MERCKRDVNEMKILRLRSVNKIKRLRWRYEMKTLRWRDEEVEMGRCK